MTVSWRASALASRHRVLGSKLEDWNGMGTPWSYDHPMADDHVAVRTKAGLIDVSGLKKLHFVGPHAAPVLDAVTTGLVSQTGVTTSDKETMPPDVLRT